MHFTWRFAPVQATAAAGISDVNATQFPFELVRGTKREQDDHEDEGVLSSPKQRLLIDLDERFVARAAATLDAARDQSMRVKVAFDRTLFHLDALRPGVEYDRAMLLDAHRSHHIRSSWFNICDLNSASLTALVADLRSTAASMAATVDAIEPSATGPTKERLDVYIKFQQQRTRDLKLTYALTQRASDNTLISTQKSTGDDIGLSDAKWRLLRCKVNMGTRYAFDISAQDDVSFRVRAFKTVHATAKVMEQASASLRINSSAVARESTATAPPRVDLLHGSTLALGGVRVESVRRMRHVSVPFRGLQFTLLEASSGELQLEARLRSAVSLQAASTMSLGAQFSVLQARVRSILASYS